MSSVSSPALGYQLSCCLAVKPFLTVTGRTKEQSGKGGGVNTRGSSWDWGKRCHLLYAMCCPCSHLMHMPSI